jgi:hypothetical protein
MSLLWQVLIAVFVLLVGRRSLCIKKTSSDRNHQIGIRAPSWIARTSPTDTPTLLADTHTLYLKTHDFNP